MTRLLEEVGYPSAVDIRAEFSEILADIEAEMSSVLNARGGHARPLYEMLETVRAFAALELTASGERDEALEGLAHCYIREASLAAEG